MLFVVAGLFLVPVWFAFYFHMKDLIARNSPGVRFNLLNKIAIFICSPIITLFLFVYFFVRLILDRVIKVD